MKEDNSNFPPMEFESPVEFILVGVDGTKRAIVAKSVGAKLDLAAYAQRENKHEINISLTKSMIFRQFALHSSYDLKPISIDSVPTDLINNILYDSRSSELTFVWRGAIPSDSRIYSLKKEFDIRAAEIADAIDKKSKSRLEWLLSPIIDDCNKMTIQAKNKKYLYRFSFLFFSFIYFALLMYYFFYKGML
ncbi:hypothetical protein [Aeromonas caviae]|uniref:hypothetical protein n=1 Tax=Aeromonas caviae TaxID=648 RepID=UPI0029DB1273|nr:hypothetical protein [Aeromonas caviae]MDX7852039.1 hypothetical protein [Aeromonas caviae]